MFTSKSIIITLLCPDDNPGDELSWPIISFQLFSPEKSLKPNHRWLRLLTVDFRSPCRKSKFVPRDWRLIIWSTSWHHAILPANVLLIGLNYQISKDLDSENKYIRLRPIPHAPRNLQILDYVQEIDYDYWAAILHELNSKI